MTPSPSARDAGTWVRDHRFWEFTFAGVLVATCVVIAATENLTPVAKAVAVALLAGQVPGYVFLGRRMVTEDVSHPQRMVYLLLIAGLFVPATVVAPPAAFGLFAIAPLCYMVVHPFPATLAVAAFNAGPIAALITDSAASGPDVIARTATVAVSVLVSFVLGMWIYRIVRQSRERAELIRELDATRAELAEVSRHAGVLEERRRMAREIHDTLAQGFAGIAMLIESAESDPGGRYLRLAHRAARDNLADARALVSGSLDLMSLPESLRATAERCGEESGAEAGFTVTGEQRRLDAQIELAVLRMVQESLANARKHSGADRIEVELGYTPGMLRVLVRDNGCGFDTSAVHGGYGLPGLRERVDRLGGEVDITASEAGTTVCVVVPT